MLPASLVHWAGRREVLTHKSCTVKGGDSEGNFEEWRPIVIHTGRARAAGAPGTTAVDRIVWFDPLAGYLITSGNVVDFKINVSVGICGKKCTR